MTPSKTKNARTAVAQIPVFRRPTRRPPFPMTRYVGYIIGTRAFKVLSSFCNPKMRFEITYLLVLNKEMYRHLKRLTH